MQTDGYDSDVSGEAAAVALPTIKNDNCTLGDVLTFMVCSGCAVKHQCLFQVGAAMGPLEDLSTTISSSGLSRAL